MRTWRRMTQWLRSRTLGTWLFLLIVAPVFAVAVLPKQATATPPFSCDASQSPGCCVCYVDPNSYPWPDILYCWDYGFTGVQLCHNTQDICEGYCTY